MRGLVIEIIHPSLARPAAACGSGSDTRDSGAEWTVSVLTAWALTYQGLEKFLRCLKLFTESNRSDYVALSLSLLVRDSWS